MTKRNQKTTGEMISTMVFAGGGVVLALGALDPELPFGERLLLWLGALGGFAAAGRFVIAALWARWR